MPFTAAHTAAALPFRQSRLVPSALVAGTIAPDLMYFLRLGPRGGFGHTLAGAFLFSLPAAMIFLWMLHRFVKKPVVSVMPTSIQQKLMPWLGPFRFGGPSRFALVAISCLVGIATHIAWDSFTHPALWLYQHWAWLSEPITVPVLGPIQHCRLLQHVSTVAGLGVVAIWLIGWYRRAQVSEERFEPAYTPAQKADRVLVVTAVAVFVGLVRGWHAVGPPENLNLFRAFAGKMVVTSVAILWWQVVLIGSKWRFRRFAATKVA